MIFVIEDGGSPWTLMMVSRAFRRTALGTPRIWSGISLCGEEKQASGKKRPATRGLRWESGKENCCNAKQLRRALERAKAAPLDLEINCRDGYSIATDEKMKEMVTMVAGERLSQWRSLAFAVEDNVDLSDEFSGSLEGLTFLRLNSFHPHLYNCLRTSARNLRNVEIYVENRPLSRLANAPWWQHIRRLLLDIPLQQIGSLNMTGIRTIQCRSAVDILSKAIELEDLTVQFPFDSKFARVNGPIHFLRLKKLTLRNTIGLLSSISAPLLTHLEIQTGERSDVTTLSPGSIFLPAVTHLSVFPSPPEALASFHCPSLIELCLCRSTEGYTPKSKNDDMVEGGWSPNNDPKKHLKPSVLRIKNLFFTWTVLRDLLRFRLHDCLRELSLIDSPLPRSFFKALMVVTPSGIICSNLQQLSVIYRIKFHRRGMGQDEGEVILRDIFTQRKEQNLGLRRVIAQWLESRVEYGDDSAITVETA